MNRPSVLVVDDKVNLLRLLSRLLADRHDVTSVADGAQALMLLASRRFDVVLTDVKMPGADGFEVLAAARRPAHSTEVIMMTAYGSVPDAVEAMRRGAFDYLQKPFEPDDVVLVVARALEQRRRGAPAGAPAGPPAAGAETTDTLARTPYREVLNLARDRTSHEYLTALMREFGGNVTRAAEQAGVERESLHRLLKRYGVQSEDFKKSG